MIDSYISNVSIVECDVVILENVYIFRQFTDNNYSAVTKYEQRRKKNLTSKTFILWGILYNVPYYDYIMMICEM